MGDPLEIHRKSTDNPWRIDGKSIENPREIHWKSMGNPLEIQRESMGNQRKSIGTPGESTETHRKSNGNLLEFDRVEGGGGNANDTKLQSATHYSCGTCFDHRGTTRSWRDGCHACRSMREAAPDRAVHQTKACNRRGLTKSLHAAGFQCEVGLPMIRGGLKWSRRRWVVCGDNGVQLGAKVSRSHGPMRWNEVSPSPVVLLLREGNERTKTQRVAPTGVPKQTPRRCQIKYTRIRPHAN